MARPPKTKTNRNRNRKTSKFPLWKVTVGTLCRTIAIATIILQPSGNGSFVSSLAARPGTKTALTRPHPSSSINDNDNDNSNSVNHNTISNSNDLLLMPRKQFLSGFVGAAAALLLAPTIASAGIDVSALKVEAANPLDVFLGGTYFEDSNDAANAISRYKYTIVEAPTSRTVQSILPPTAANPKTKKKNPKNNPNAFFEDLDRPVLIQGESTSISSSKDDAFELKGNLLFCNEKGSKGCIVIDFFPIGGPRDAKGYWDEKESAIRFLDSPRVWSKQ